MKSPVVQQALSMDFAQSQIKMAIRKQLREKGTNFKNVEALVSTVMTCQNEEGEIFEVPESLEFEKVYGFTTVIYIGRGFTD